MATHHLKLWPVWYEQVITGVKPFEYRLNDRNYKVGDFLHLHEFRPLSQEYTGRECRALVTCMLTHYEIRALPYGYVILGLRLPVEVVSE